MYDQARRAESICRSMAHTTSSDGLTDRHNVVGWLSAKPAAEVPAHKIL